jgi:hypothetical protein
MEETKTRRKLKLADQALGALMMALQQSLLAQSDIVPVLKGFDFYDTVDGLVVANPPVVEYDDDAESSSEEEGGAIFNAYLDAIETSPVTDGVEDWDSSEEGC